MKSNELVREYKFSKVRFSIILILILIGIALCLDLSYIFYKTNFLETYQKSFCSISQLIDCDGVSKTVHSMFLGVPNALWGLLLYCVMLMLLFVDRIQMKFKNTIFDVFKNPRSYIATLGLLAFGISMYLAYVSIMEIKKICYLCFCTYLIDLLIALFAVKKNFFFADIKNTVLDFIDGAKKHFILFLIVLTAFCSTLYYLNKTIILSPRLQKQILEERNYKEFFEAKRNKYAIKGNVLGNKKADVVIKVYSDFNCPYCRVLNIMLHKAVKEERILVKEINFPLDKSCNKRIGGTLGGHELSCLYSRYALTAQEQGKFWGAANILFDDSPKSEDDLVKIFEEKLNLKVDKLKSDANSPAIEKQLQKEINAL